MPPPHTVFLCEQDQERSYDRQASVVTVAGGPSSVPPQGAAERSAGGGNAASAAVPPGIGASLQAAPSELALLASAANQVMFDGLCLFVGSSGG